MPVERIAKKRAALFFHADDAHRQSADLQSLSNRVTARKEFLSNVAAQHTHQCRTLHFIGRNKAAVGDDFVFNLRHVRSNAKDDGARKLDAVLLQI